MKATRILVTTLAALAVLSQMAPAATQGDATNGKRLAEQWCASCHLVAPEQTSATTEAPPFQTLAQLSPTELAELGSALSAPHPPMPDLSLSRAEISDLLAYIASLKE